MSQSTKPQAASTETGTAIFTRKLHPLIDLQCDRTWFEELQNRLARGGPWDDWTLYQLTMEAEQAKRIESFEQLLCLRSLPAFEPMPHQISTARKVVHEMGGRAILADEVGLGKTIEAGLVLKEYIVRGLAKRVLILVPASLVLQWVRELNQKFGIPAVAQKKEHTWGYDVVVASIDTAKRDPHRELVLGTDYDLIIIDEAHKLKNKKTTNYQFANLLRKKYCLLLTATPIQNDLDELYNLITLLKPGQLGGQSEFAANFVVDKRLPKNEDQLQEALSTIMIRNRRGDGGIHFTRRFVKNVPLALSDEEKALYDAVTGFVKERYEESGGDLSSMLSLVTLQREVCSSRDAVFLTLVNLFKKTAEDSPVRPKIWELVDKIKQIKANTKAEKAMELVKQFNDEKVIIFTEYRATQEYLLQFFREKNMIAVPYRGGMNRGKKDWMMDLFRGRAQVLIATEAGGEGINLQFCHHMINFDLPWNPMRVEQRIGRVHRLGQTEDVKIYNLCTIGTIEEHIVNLLHEKINLFELVIGELDHILERFESGGGSLEQKLAKVLLEAGSDTVLKEQLNQLGSSLSQIRSEVQTGLNPYAAAAPDLLVNLDKLGEDVEARP
ncbi:DEAD/DEAH box helicase [Paenibacillus harenae]|uniref:DEAD/DEAH box helicase n=1 Tax=Paenibacillus harenae TaxID=306543 RepID=UPI0003FD0227|nr:SNF2-related protein [Paenibacillus harenae]